MLQQEIPDDYVIATGQMHSVREFVETAFKEIGEEIVWEGSGMAELGRERRSGKVRVRVDKRYLRPTEVVSTVLEGDVVAWLAPVTTW
jgi:GDPmannose 4,6-dehydratase